MQKFQIEIGASNTISKSAKNGKELRANLSRVQGRVSIIADCDYSESAAGVAGKQEVFCGTADQAREWAKEI